MQVTEKIKLVWLYECWDKQSSVNKKKNRDSLHENYALPISQMELPSVH